MNETPTTLPVLPFLPPPSQGRYRRPLPPATIALLLLLRGLLVYASDLLALLGQAAERGLSLIARCFGSAQAGFVLTHLTTGILRAIALEHVLLARAASASDPAAGKPRKRMPHPAQPDAPRLPRPSHDQLAGLPTLPQLAAAIRRRPVEATVDEICHDFGLSFSLCEARFGNALRDMVAACRTSLSHVFQECLHRTAAAAGVVERDSARDFPPQKPDAIRYIEGCLGAQQPVCGLPFTASPVGAASVGAQPFPEPA